MRNSVLKDKSENFADRIVKLYKYLDVKQHEKIISKQILRSGTSIGANIAEAAFAASKKDFLSKLTISAKECSETIYWLNRLKAGDFIKENEFESIHNDCLEFGRLLSS